MENKDYFISDIKEKNAQCFINRKEQKKNAQGP